MADASVWNPGSGAVIVDAESTNLSETIILTEAQTIVSLSSFTYVVGTSSIAVYLNGQRLIKGIDWTERNSQSINLLISVIAGNSLEVVSVVGSASDSAAVALEYALRAEAAATTGTSWPVVDYLDFAAVPVASAAERRMRWNDADGTVDLGMGGGNVTLQVGQESLVRVLNNTGSTMNELAVVRISGATGNRLTATLAKSLNSTYCAGTIGVLTESIANNAQGFATSFGLVRNINTSAFAEGAVLYLDANNYGGLTAVAPVAPFGIPLRIGVCVRSHATQGSIFVSVQGNIDTVPYTLGGTGTNALPNAANGVLHLDGAGKLRSVSAENLTKIPALPKGALIECSSIPDLSKTGMLACSGETTASGAGVLPSDITITARTFPVATLARMEVNAAATMYVGAVQVAANATAIYSSPDAITWTLRTLPVARVSPCLVYDPMSGRFVTGGWLSTAVGTLGTAYSTDGITWTAGGTPTGIVSAMNNMVTNNAGIIVAYNNTVATTITQFGCTSSDGGSTWTAFTLTGTPTAIISFCEYNAGTGTFLMMFTGDNTYIYESSDGITWTRHLKNIPVTTLTKGSGGWWYAFYNNSTYAYNGSGSFSLVSGYNPTADTLPLRVFVSGLMASYAVSPEFQYVDYNDNAYGVSKVTAHLYAKYSNGGQPVQLLASPAISNTARIRGVSTFNSKTLVYQPAVATYYEANLGSDQRLPNLPGYAIKVQ